MIGEIDRLRKEVKRMWVGLREMRRITEAGAVTLQGLG